MLKFFSAFSFIFFLSSFLFADDHVVVQGDTLSLLAQKYLGEPVYRKNGSLERILAMNPWIQRTDHLPIGSKVRIRKGEIQRNIASETPEWPTSHKENLPLNKLIGNFKVGLDTYYSLLKGKDRSRGTEAVIVSDLNLRGNILALQTWNSRFQTQVLLRVSFESYTKDEGELQSIQSRSKVLTRLEKGGEFSLTPNYKAVADLGLGEEIFYRGLESRRGILLEKKVIPKVRAGILYQKRTHENADVIGKLTPFLLLPNGSGNFKTNLTMGVEGSLGFKHHLGQKYYSLEVFYNQQFQQNKIVEILRKDIGIQLGFSWPFGS